MSESPSAYWTVSLTGEDVHCWWTADGEPEHELNPSCVCGPTGWMVAEHESAAGGGTIPAHKVYVHEALATTVPPVPVDLTAAVAL
jgi:hypothetical protein